MLPVRLARIRTLHPPNRSEKHCLLPSFGKFTVFVYLFTWTGLPNAWSACSICFKLLIVTVEQTVRTINIVSKVVTWLLKRSISVSGGENEIMRFSDSPYCFALSPYAGIGLTYAIHEIYRLCSFVCCVLFERGVLFCVICVFLCVVSHCSTTAADKTPFAIQLIIIIIS
jgi:hypothetical protein